MNEIIKYFSQPSVKYSSDSYHHVKSRIVGSCFKVTERQMFFEWQSTHLDESARRLETGKPQSLADLADLFTRHNRIVRHYDTLDDDVKVQFMRNMKIALTTLNEPETNIVRFIVPNIYSLTETQFSLDFMLMLCEIYDGMDVIIHTLLIALEVYNSKRVNETYIIDRCRNVLFINHFDHIMKVLNPITSPFRQKDTHGDVYSGVLSFFDRLDNIIDDVKFRTIINDAIHKKQGIDMTQLFTNDDLNEKFTTFILNANNKELRGFFKCLLQNYNGDDKSFVMTSNARWLKTTIRNIEDEDVKSNINNMLKLLNITL